MKSTIIVKLSKQDQTDFEALENSVIEFSFFVEDGQIKWNGFGIGSSIELLDKEYYQDAAEEAFQLIHGMTISQYEHEINSDYEFWDIAV